jgi:hypothetical protein
MQGDLSFLLMKNTPPPRPSTTNVNRTDPKEVVDLTEHAILEDAAPRPLDLMLRTYLFAVVRDLLRSPLLADRARQLLAVVVEGCVRTALRQELKAVLDQLQVLQREALAAGLTQASTILVEQVRREVTTAMREGALQALSKHRQEAALVSLEPGWS